MKARDFQNASMEKSSIEFLKKNRVVAVIRPQSVRESLETARACADAGLRTVEIISVSPAAREAIRELSSSGDVCVGAGTVMSRDSAEEFCSLGARFVVSPHTDPEIIEYCGEAGVAVIQGAFTSSEMVTAAKAGADFVKIFPASSFGPDYVRAVKQALPFLEIMVTGGITADNIRDYFDAGASLAGVSTALAAGGADYASVRRTAGRLLEIAG